MLLGVPGPPVAGPPVAAGVAVEAAGAVGATGGTVTAVILVWGSTTG